MQIEGYLVKSEAQYFEANYFVYTKLDDALRFAKEKARLTGLPWNVYKLVQTHYVTCPQVVVSEV